MRKIILTFFIYSLLSAICHAQMVSPDVKCLRVATNGDVTITWTIPPAGNFVDYKIFSSPFTPAGPYGLVGTVNTYAQTSFIDVGAGANTKRVYYKVQTEYNPGNILSAPKDTFSTIFLNVNNPGNGTALLAWNKISFQPISTSSGWYKIYREYPIGTWTLRDSTQTLAYTDIIDVCNDTISYRIEISDNTGCTSVSNIGGGKFKDQSPPVISPIDTVSVNAANRATISWNPSPSPDADSVIIYTGCGPWNPIATIPVPQTFYTYTLSNAATVSECFRVAFKDSCGNLSAQGIEHRTIYLMVNFDICAATASLVWNKYVNMNPAVTQYEIYKSVNANPFTLLATTAASDTDYVDNNIALGNSYCYLIRASNGTKTSSSNRVCFTANVSSPPAFTYNRYATVLSDKSIEITGHVDYTSGVKYYRLQRATAGSGIFSTVLPATLPAGSAVTFTDNGVAANVNSYSYRWLAMDSCNHVIQTSNTATTIFLTATISSNLDVDLTWSDYSSWDGTVDYYEIYRGVDGVWNPSPIGTYSYTGTGGTFTDDVSPYFASKGFFSYYVVAKEKAGNSFGFQDSSASNIAKVFEYPKIYVPNAFTPNGDGKNDIFIPVIGFIEPSDYSFKIFDNTGTPVMWTSIASEGWDGRKNGHLCPAGVYMYLVQGKASNGDDFKIAGTVSLFR